MAAAVGVLILGLSGTCTALFIRSSPTATPLALLFGGPFIVLGAATVVAAIQWIRRGRPVIYAPTLGAIYSLFSGLGVVVGIALLQRPGLPTLVAFGLAIALGWLAWRITK